MNEYLNEAYKQALKSLKHNDIPVGCIIVYKNKIIAKAFNIREHSNFTIGHAELLALTKANRKLKDWQLPECEVYVTLEPCLMCYSALSQAHIKKIYCGTKSEKNGAITKYHINDNKVIIMNDENCKNLIKDFFKKIRQNGR